MKKITTIILIVSIASFLIAIKTANAYGELSVEISDNYVGHSPEYVITFSTPSDLVEGEKIKIAFDEDVYFISENLKGKIFLNGVSVVSEFETTSNSILVTMPFNFNHGKILKILISEGVMINPSSSCYLRLTLTLDEGKYTSNFYKITNITSVKNVKLYLLEDSFKISFDIGNHTLLKGYTMVRSSPVSEAEINPGDYIYIQFSPLLSKAFSNFLSMHEIKVNGTNPPVNPTLTIKFENSVNERKIISVMVPKDIYSNVEIEIKGFARNITLPESFSGDAFVNVWTSKETTAIESNHIEVKPANYIETVISLTPNSPDGENGYFISSPTLELNVYKGSSIEKIETFINIDDSGFEDYKGPIMFNDGVHRVKYYSEGCVGSKIYSEDFHEVILKIDTKAPEIEVNSPIVSKGRIYTFKATITEDNLKEIKVQLGNILHYPYGSSIEIPMLLFTQETPFIITVKDFAGNVTEYKGVIKLANSENI